MPLVFFITHPDVRIDPKVPVPEWPLDERGRARMRAMATHRWVRGIRSIFCSGERKALTPSAVEKLVSYPWPGNVRELENMIEQAASLAPHEALSDRDIRFEAVERDTLYREVIRDRNEWKTGRSLQPV